MAKYSYKNIERRAISRAESDPLETAVLAGGGITAIYGTYSQNQSVTAIGVIALIGYGLYKFLS